MGSNSRKQVQPLNNLSSVPYRTVLNSRKKILKKFIDVEVILKKGCKLGQNEENKQIGYQLVDRKPFF